MAAGKNPYLRYRILHACLSNGRKRYWTKQELIARLRDHDLDVEARTLAYDLEAMRYDERLNYHAPIAYCKKNKGFYYTDPNFSIDAIPFTAKELRSLVFAFSILQKYAGVALVSQFEAVFHKVVKVVSEWMIPNAKRKSIIAFEKAPYYKGLVHFDVVHQATEEEQPLRIVYQKFTGAKESVHIFHPYFMKEHKGRLYVIGYSASRKTILTLGLDRMEQVTEERIPFRANTEVDAENYFHHTLGVTLTSGAVETVELWFSALQGQYIKTQHLHHSQRTVRDDKHGLVISLALIPNYELTSLILSYGPAVRVLTPASLRQQVKTELEKGLAGYG